MPIPSQLKELEDDCVVRFKVFNKNTLCIVYELCDRQFEHILDKTDMQQLVNELQTLTDFMEE